MKVIAYQNCNCAIIVEKCNRAVIQCTWWLPRRLKTNRGARALAAMPSGGFWALGERVLSVVTTGVQSALAPKRYHLQKKDANILADFLANFR